MIFTHRHHNLMCDGHPGNKIGAYTCEGAIRRRCGVQFDGCRNSNINTISECWPAANLQKPFTDYFYRQQYRSRRVTLKSDTKYAITAKFCSGAIIGGYAVIGSGVPDNPAPSAIEFSLARMRHRPCLAVVKDVEANTTVYGNPANPKYEEIYIIGLCYIARFI